jgi:glycosyltransferase involved in cell wall biosynthesis
MIAAKLKRETRLPWVADFRDPWARRPWGATPENPWGQKLFGLLEGICIKGADAVILNTEALRQDFMSHYSPELHEKFSVITNGFDPEARLQVAERPLGEDPVRTEGAIHIFHAGTFYMRRDPRAFIRAIGILIRRGYRVTFEHMGHIDHAWDLGAYARQHGAEQHVVLRPQDRHEVVLERMRRADVMLIVQPDTHLQVPSKLFEMLLCQRPILALVDEGETAQIIRRFGLGVVANPRDPESIAEAIPLAARMHPLDRAKWTLAMRAFDGRQLTGKLADCLATVTCRPAEVWNGRAVASRRSAVSACLGKQQSGEAAHEGVTAE